MSICWVEARKPTLLTRPFGPIRIPLGFSSQIWPFAVRFPLMTDADVPVTRFTRIEVDEGWTNSTR